MTTVQAEKARALLDGIKAKERETNPGNCKMFSQGEECSCVLCLCDELCALIPAHVSCEFDHSPPSNGRAWCAGCGIELRKSSERK